MNTLVLIIALGFSAVSGQVVWEKEYQTEKSFKQLYQAIRISGVLTDQDSSENIITGHTVLFPADYRGAGYSEMKVPIYIGRNDISCFVVYEYGDSTYKVTVKNIMFVQSYSDALFDAGSKMDIETLVLKKGEFKPGFHDTAEKVLNYTFDKRFKQ